MYSEVKTRLSDLVTNHASEHLNNSLIGIEKESLRVNQDANISQTPHPRVLGSALTHPAITTDYSEALIEFITPPLNSIKTALQYIEDLHKFVYKRLNNEMFWATSMPCVVTGESNIPVAQYGSSNIGKMKTIYREGLGHRYGKTMQIIAGVHYNFSFSDDFWNCIYASSSATTDKQTFITQQYFSLIRNLLRVGWIIPYLFGASPAVCRSFFGDYVPDLDLFDENTYYKPYATSLRMSDIGYQNNKENEKGIKASYDNLEAYIDHLKYAIQTPCPEYEKIGVKVNDEYMQLNANILQIENEYYSTVRPKQITNSNEQPINALKKRGIQYIELRSIDINAFDPFGVNEEQLHFLETLMLFCLLADSPEINMTEQDEIDENEMITALEGRKKGLELKRNGMNIPLEQWANEIFDALHPIAELLDNVHQCHSYSRSVKNISMLVQNPDLSPSARMLEIMQDNSEGFHYFAKRMSIQHNNYFKQLVLSKDRNNEFEQMVKQSIARQAEVEARDTQTFEDFLSAYYADN